MGIRELVRSPTGNEPVNVFREADGVVVYGQLVNNPESSIAVERAFVRNAP